MRDCEKIVKEKRGHRKGRQRERRERERVAGSERIACCEKRSFEEGTDVRGRLHRRKKEH